MTGNPFVAIIAPRPVSADPDVIGGRTRADDFLLHCRWGLRDDHGALRAGGSDGRRVHDGRLRLSDHRSTGRRRGNDMGIGFGGAAANEQSETTRGKNRHK